MYDSDTVLLLKDTIDRQFAGDSRFKKAGEHLFKNVQFFTNIVETPVSKKKKKYRNSPRQTSL